MFKVYILIIYIFIFCPSFSQNMFVNPQFMVHYNFTFQSDSTDSNSKKTVHMVLMIEGQNSYFFDWNYIKQDSIYKSILDGTTSPDKLLGNLNKFPKPDLNFILKKKKNTSQIAYFERIGGGSYFFEEDNDFQWNITNERIRLGGYKVQKATCRFKGRNYKAWFSSDLPISDGPYKFKGLPGLILQVSDDDDYFNFTVLSMGKVLNESYELKQFRNARKIEKNDLIALKQLFIANPFAFPDGDNIIIDQINKEIILRNAEQNIKRPRNPMERNE
jgi:GLPGLI family protein